MLTSYRDNPARNQGSLGDQHGHALHLHRRLALRVFFPPQRPHPPSQRANPQTFQNIVLCFTMGDPDPLLHSPLAQPVAQIFLNVLGKAGGIAYSK